MAKRQPEPAVELADWGRDLNLSLYWTSWEYGSSPNGSPWSQARGLLWSINPRRVLASIHVYNDQSSIIVQCPEGLDKWTRAAVEKHLNLLQEHGWF